MSKRGVSISPRSLHVSRQEAPVSQCSILISQQAVQVSQGLVPVSQNALPVSIQSFLVSRRSLQSSGLSFPVSQIAFVKSNCAFKEDKSASQASNSALRQQMSCCLVSLLALVIWFCLAFVAPRASAAEARPEHEVKAAFLVKFAAFVEWPATAFAQTNSPVVIGVLGSDPFGSQFESNLRAQTLGGRNFVLRRCATAGDADVAMSCSSARRNGGGWARFSPRWIASPC